MDLPQLIKVDGIGYLASLLVLLTFCMNTMMTLRAVAICSNLAFVIYGVAANVYPVLLLHLILLPLNALHLIKMVWLLRRAKLAAATDLSPHWLQPFMRTKRIKAGETLFAKGEYADALYMIVSGEVELSEIELKLKPGDLFGEIELFSVERRRTQSALARSDLELLWISGAELKKLCERNPGLSLYFLRLMASRLTNTSRFERRSLVKADSDAMTRIANTTVRCADSGEPALP
jgi:CRP/FNR family transcriptional regulator, cyclic AMP receptor protein